MHTREDIDKLANEFEQCQKILVALGDENRQHMILEMMKMGNCSGVRVNEITEKTHLSRPAVSHHLQILKDAGILKMRRLLISAIASENGLVLSVAISSIPSLSWL